MRLVDLFDLTIGARMFEASDLAEPSGRDVERGRDLRVLIRRLLSVGRAPSTREVD